jgi:membrane-bound serine protease (ClpP class)
LPRRLIALLALLLGALLLADGARAQAAPPVLVVPIQGTIDLGLAPYLERVLRTAEEQGAAAVVLDLETPGGRLDAALLMRDALLDTPVRTIAFVDREAFSAGALLALAAQELYVAPGAAIGAATPVYGDGAPADAKTISAVRGLFRATAEARGRDPQLAEAMVDPAVEVAGLVGPGELLTLTADDATRLGLADGAADDIPALLAAAGLEGAELRQVAPGPAEALVRALTSPAIATLLVAIGLLLLVADALVGGLGWLSVGGLALLALFFWGHMLAGLAGWEGVALVILGVLLLALEALVIPGFGVAGILGIAALLGGVFLSLTGGIVTPGDLARVAWMLLAMVALPAAGLALLLRRLPESRLLRGVVLQTKVGADPEGARRGGPLLRWLGGARLEALTAPAAPETERLSLLGQTGRTTTALRPAGVAEFGGRPAQVTTRGEYLGPGEPVMVVEERGSYLVVRRTEAA